MKIVILITVIESSAVMLAILYFYYRRSQSGKRFSFSSPAEEMKYESSALELVPRANGEGKNSKIKNEPGKPLGFNSESVKGGYIKI